MASIQQVFQGSASIAIGSETTSVTLSEAIDLTRSFLLFSIRTDGNNNNIGAALIGGEITNSTTITFRRVGTVRNVWINWQICEFDSSVTVYRGSTNLSSLGATNVTIPAVNLTKTFVIFSASMGYVSSDLGGEEAIRATLTSSTNLELYVNGYGNNLVYWQVIQYEHCTVQQLTFQPLAYMTQTDVTIPVAVDLTRTLIVGSYYTTIARMANNQQYIYYLLNSSTLRLYHQGGFNETISWTIFIIEFEENEVRVTNLNTSISSSSLTVDITLSELFTNYSIIKMSSNDYNSLALIYDGDDNLQYSFFTQVFTSNTSLQLQRVVSNIAGEARLQVVEFIPREKRLPFRGLNRGIIRRHIMT